MARIYYRKVKDKNNPMTLEQVPEKWREQVRQLLSND